MREAMEMYHVTPSLLIWKFFISGEFIIVAWDEVLRQLSWRLPSPLSRVLVNGHNGSCCHLRPAGTQVHSDGTQVHSCWYSGAQ